MQPNDVASFTDAWIETFVAIVFLHETYVASFTDAWIETPTISQLFSGGYKSHLLQMRGLKPYKEGDTRQKVESHLLQMRGLKLNLK